MKQKTSAMWQSLRTLTMVKPPLVDRLLWSSHVFRENQEVAERVLDSNDQEASAALPYSL